MTRIKGCNAVVRNFSCLRAERVHRIEFLKLKLENFRSWERLEISLRDQGAVLVTGRNGAGKSSIPAALAWGLFGKNFNRITPKDLIRRGTKKCRVAVSCKNPAGQLIKLSRERVGKLERVRLDDGTGVRELGVKEATLWLPRVLGMGWRAFSNTVFVGSGINRFFLMLPDGEKKELLEDLLRVKQFDGCSREAAHRVRELDGQSDSLRIKAHSLQSSLDRLEQEIVQAQELGVLELEKKIDQLRERVLALEDKLGPEGSLGDLEETLDRCSEELEKHKNLFSKLNFQVSSLDSQIARIESLEGHSCPECGRSLSQKEAQSLISQKRGQLEKLSEIQTPLYEKIGDLRKELHELHAEVSCMAKLHEERKSLIRELEATREERERVSLCYQDLLENQRQYYQKRFEAFQEKEARISMLRPYFDFWVRGFGPKGIRADLLQSVLPWLTECSNRYLASLSDQFRLEFDFDRGEFISRIFCRRLGEVQYQALSAGERRRLDLSVNLALREIVAQSIGSSSNLTILDEVVENLDVEGAQQFADLVKELSIGRTAFIISHNDFLESCFDNVWRIKKQKGISELVHD